MPGAVANPCNPTQNLADPGGLCELAKKPFPLQPFKGPSDMVQWVKVLATTPDDHSSVSKTHMVGELPSQSCVHCGIHVPPSNHTDIHINKNKALKNKGLER